MNNLLNMLSSQEEEDFVSFTIGLFVSYLNNHLRFKHIAMIYCPPDKIVHERVGRILVGHFKPNICNSF